MENFGNYSNGEQALPEPRITKRRILQSRDTSRELMLQLTNNQDLRTFNQFRSSVLRFYQDIQNFIDVIDKPEKNYEELHKLRYPQKSYTDYKQVDFKDDIQPLIDYWYQMDELVKDLGITNIGIETGTEDFGRKWLNGLPHSLPDKWYGWKEMQMTLKEMRRILRKDVDLVGVVTGPNRVGKDTFGLQAMRIVQNGENTGVVDESHIILNDDDFWKATNDLDQYDAAHITELSKLFYSKDAMDSKQKDRKKKLKTFAARNMFLIGCDTNFYNIDKEMRSDKVAFNVHIPRRGYFEFYSKKKVDQFEKDTDSGEAVRPKPDFEGHFPKLEDELWDLYKDIEEEKYKIRDDNEESKLSIHDIAEEVKRKEKRYKKVWKQQGQIIINKSLIAADFEIGDRKAGKVKELVEADLGLPKDVEKEEE